MRQIEIGDINRTLLHAIELPKGKEKHPSHTCVERGLNLVIDDDAQNFVIRELMGHLSYRSRQPLVRVLDRIKQRGGDRIPMFDLWADLGAQHLERRHTLFVKAGSFEQWRRDFHDLDEDLPGVALLARDDAALAPDVARAFGHFRHWHTFVTGDDRQLAQELAKGVACQHVHLAGSYPAPYFWVGLMNRRFKVDTLFNEMGSGRPYRYPYPEDPEALRGHIRRAIVLRRALFGLADALLAGALDGKRGKLIDALKAAIAPAEPSLDAAEGDAMAADRGDGTDYAEVLRKRSEGATLRPDWATCRSLLGERLLLYTLLHKVARARRGLDPDAELDEIVARALWVYLQAKNLFLGTAQQREGISGFDYFEYTLRQISWMKNKAERKTCAQEIGSFLQESGSVVKLELMVAPGEDAEEYSTYFEILRHLQEAMTDRLSVSLRAQHGGVRVGLIVHFIKSPGESLSTRSVGGDAAYLIYHCGVRDETLRLADVLLAYLESDKYKTDRQPGREEARGGRGALVPDLEICAIDTANRELHCPPEVFGPTYRKFSRRRIGRTYHVGEDFLHMMTGLRRIYEAIEFLDLHAGDRLGHCIALGMSPKLWVHANPTASMHHIDMLDDAVFEWTLLQKHGSGDPLRLTQLERQIARSSMDIYGVPIDPHVLQTAWRGRAGDFLRGAGSFKVEANVPAWVQRQGRIMNKATEARRAAGVPPPAGTHNVIPSISELNAVAQAYGVDGDAIRPGEWPQDLAERVLIEYLYDRHTIQREIAMSPVPTLPDLPHIVRVQEILREVVMSMGLTVESNPSSNWLIGGFERLYDVPAVEWSLRHPTFPMTINPDDPVTFSTSIENEYFFVFSCLLRGTDELPGLSRLEALERIRRIREQGLESSFLQ
jgi:hypothetical protein